VSLSNLPKLALLHLYSNEISSLSLSTLPSLGELILADNRLISTSGFAGLTTLATLELGGNALEDLSGLSGLVALQRLGLGSVGSLDTTTLRSMLLLMPELQILDVSYDGLTSAAWLAGLPPVEWLYLQGNGITDIGPLDDTSASATLGSGDVTHLTGNFLCDAAQLQHIQNLMDRGVYVGFVFGRTSTEEHCFLE
jgi:internalin A